jgi:YD repeat-containing protein
MNRIVLLVICMLLSGASWAGNQKNAYPNLIVPGMPEDFIYGIEISWPLGISDVSTLNQKLVSPKSVSKITVYENEKISEEYFLDKKGRIIQEISHYSSGGGSNVNYSYDSAGNLVSKTYIPKKETYEYRYSKRDDGLFERDEFDKQKEEIVEQILFDSEGKVIQFKNGDSVKYDRTYDNSFKYDGGRVVEVKSRTTPGMICFSDCQPYVMKIEYPSNGVVVAYPQNNPNERLTVEFSKDTIDAVFYMQHKPFETRTEFSFDAKGNWVEKKGWTVKDMYGRPGKDITTTRREITYR